ncbi:NADPH-dependent FMN reductase [uncultured Aquimarina sp.]|uniref:NADPH-dependent FMN reductase n=1 Tax=uncultured Aquimarina sp. TaxID=575652 RepID=UPI002613D75A|nr:NADPH-dependent FMN reductase [uncultured Aquimarina sp.]
MKKIIALGASNSKNSINKLFATYVANHLENTITTTLDLNDYTLPLYSPDLEVDIGIPKNAVDFNQLISSTDGIVLSMAEYNGLPTAAFVNLFDWLSRIDQNVWQNKPILLMAVSPGGRGGANVLKIINDLMPFFGGKVITSFSLPSFPKNFQEGRLINEQLYKELSEKIELFQQSLN